jgi:hypothetical protein
VFPVTQVALEKLITRNISGLKSGVSFADVSELKRKLRNLTSLAVQRRKLSGGGTLKVHQSRNAG